GRWEVTAYRRAAHPTPPNPTVGSAGGRATTQIVHAVKSATGRVVYGEIISSIASTSAGPATRANIDEFTETTRKGIEVIGGAERGKAIIILNPAEPPLIMRNTVFCLSQGGSREAVEAAILAMIERVRGYVPG